MRLWDLRNGTQLFRLPLPIRDNPPVPLWEFDFRCSPAGCQAVVPLMNGRLVVYDFRQME